MHLRPADSRGHHDRNRVWAQKVLPPLSSLTAPITHSREVSVHNPRISLDVASVRAEPAGVGLYVALLAEQLAAMDAPLSLIGLREEAHFPNGVPGVGTRHLAGRGHHVWIQTAADREAQSLDAALVHYTNAAAPLVSQLPYVVTVHDLSVLRMPMTHPVKRWPIVLVNLVAIARAKVVIVPSRFTARELGRLGVDARRVVVIPHAPVLPIEAPQAPSAAALREFGLEPGGYTLYFGTLEPRKNIVRLVNAFERIAPRHPGLKLVLCGGFGWRYGGIVQAIDSSAYRDRIVMTGYTGAETLVPLVSDSAAVAYVSLYEGFGMPVLDAMALGAAVVTSNRTAMPEAAGGAAELVNPTDVDDIARGLNEVLAHRDDYRARSLSRAAGRTWADVAQDHMAAYRFALTRS